MNASWSALASGVSAESIFAASEYSETEKVLRINHRLFNYCRNCRPDVLLIEAPDGIIPISDRIPNEFGIKTKILSKAIPIDYSILIVPQNYKSDSEMIQLLRYAEKEYDGEVIGLVVSNYSVHEIESEIQKRIVGYYRNDKHVVDGPRVIKTPGGLVGIAQGMDEGAELICNQLLKKFSS